MKQIENINAHEFLYLWIKRAVSQPYRERFTKYCDMSKVDLTKMVKSGFVNSIYAILQLGKDTTKKIERITGNLTVGSLYFDRDFKLFCDKFNELGS